MTTSFCSDPYYRGVLAARTLVHNKCEIHLRVMLFNLRLSITSEPHGFYYVEEFCFHDTALAWHAFATWNGEADPIGWAKHPSSGRIGPGWRENNGLVLKKNTTPSERKTKHA